MNRGFGRIEDILLRTFLTDEPNRSFTVVDLAMIAFPGISTVEKRHRVSVLRAADKLAGRLGWQKSTKPICREIGRTTSSHLLARL